MMFCTWVRSVFGVIASRCADVGRAQALDEGPQDLELARGQRLDGRSLGLSFARLGHALGDRDDDVARQQRRAGVGRPDRRDDLVDRLVLGQVAVGAGLDRFEDRLVVVDRRQHDHPRGRPAGLDRPRRVRARAVGQQEVHQDDVDGLARGVPGLGHAGRGARRSGCPAPRRGRGRATRGPGDGRRPAARGPAGRWWQGREAGWLVRLGRHRPRGGLSTTRRRPLGAGPARRGSRRAARSGQSTPAPRPRPMAGPR